MITLHDYELAEVAIAASNHNEAVAMRMLRNKCGWTLRHALNVIRLVHAKNRPAITGDGMIS